MVSQSLKSAAALALIGAMAAISLSTAPAMARTPRCLFWNGCNATNATQTNLTGTWRADNGGTYLIRQTGNNVSWRASGGNWRNSFKGLIVGDRIAGSWQDTASSPTQNSGELVLRIDSNHRLSLIYRTGAGSSHVWTR